MLFKVLYMLKIAFYAFWYNVSKYGKLLTDTSKCDEVTS